MTQRTPKWLSPADAGQRLGLKRDAVIARCKRGEIEGAVIDEVSGHIHIPADAVERYKKKHWTPLARNRRRISKKVREHFPEFADRSHS